MKQTHRHRPQVSAIIAAAGTAHRMQGADKQLLPLLGVPVIVRTVAAFQQAGCVDEIVVVTRAKDLALVESLLKSMDKVTAVVEGGGTRQASVFAGVGACSPQSRYIAIHDGARPLVSGRLIAQTVAAAQQYGAAAPGIPVKETIKVVDSRGFVQTTPRRDTLCIIQTPQVFCRRVYQQAMQAAAGCSYTDDCQLAEHAGFPVFITKGEEANIKITTKQDVGLCEALLKGKL